MYSNLQYLMTPTIKKTFVKLKNNRTFLVWLQMSINSFLPKLFQGLEDTDWLGKPPESFLSDQIWTKIQFLQNWHVQKNQKCLFFRNPPASNIGSFSKYNSNEFVKFCYNLKSCLFPQNRCFLVKISHIKTKFDRTPKWSVWSIWTHSTRWIFKFVM